jgi:hypothetical protein
MSRKFARIFSQIKILGIRGCLKSPKLLSFPRRRESSLNACAEFVSLDSRLRGNDKICKSVLCKQFLIILCGMVYMAPAHAAPATQGIASLTLVETHKLAEYYGGKSEEAKAVNKIVNSAEKALQETPAPLASITTSGGSIKTGEKSNSKAVEKQAKASYTLALAYAITEKEAYFEKVKQYLLGWARVNQPDGDPVATAKLIPMFMAYDLVRDKISPDNMEMIDGWLKATGQAVISSQRQAIAENSPRAVNNHRSHALLILSVIGCVTGEQKFIHYVADKSGFLEHIGNNLASFPGEPEGAGVDYHQRKAYHYVAYNLQALGKLAIILDRLSRLPGNPYGIDYNPFMVEVKGASLLKALYALLPYATWDKINMDEFGGTENKNDLKRLENGSLAKSFKRKDAVAALEAADYFFAAVKDPVSGKSYNLAQLTLDILAEMKSGSLKTPSFPTQQFFINRILSPYNQEAAKR